MLTKLFANRLVPEVVAVPGQAASHECPDHPPAGGAPGPSPPNNSGSGGGCTSVVMVCTRLPGGAQTCIPTCVN